MTVLGGISLVVGTMIGSGIFVSPTGIISMSGSIGSALVIWVICGFIATISSLCYIELGLLVEESGAEYSYCNSAFGQLIGFLIGWTNIILCKPARYFRYNHSTFQEKLFKFVSYCCRIRRIYVSAILSWLCCTRIIEKIPCNHCPTFYFNREWSICQSKFKFNWFALKFHLKVSF